MGKNQESKKTQQKKQNKVIDDKTFGLKNKNKSKAVQKYVSNVSQQIKNGGVSSQKVIDEKFIQAKEKKKMEEEQKLLQEIYQSVETKRGPKDEKQGPTIKICPFFRQGLCQKGRKCKFSHDLTQDNKKSDELDLYTDQRAQIQDNDTIDKWDENKLLEVIQQQEKKYKQQIPTEIVCKYFLDAIENAKYGWKWVCQNGMTCHYRHCLPPGFVFKKKKKDIKEEDEEDEITIEEKIEEEKRKLDYKKGTPVTLERFLEWKQKKKLEKQKEVEKQQKQQAKQGKAKGMSGRALFDFDQALFVDDEEAVDDQEYQNREQEDKDEQEQQQTTTEQQQTITEQQEQQQNANQTIQQSKKQQHDEQEDKQDEKQQEEKKRKKKKKKKDEEDENGVKINGDAFDDL